MDSSPEVAQPHEEEKEEPSPEKASETSSAKKKGGRGKRTKKRDSETASQHSDVQSSMYAAYGVTEKAQVVSEKKRVDSDLQKLRNRVKMLEQEQARAQKKIMDTKAKANQIKKTTEENNR